jgi:hypothetical protein
LGRKLSGPREEKEEGKNGPALGWAERRRERKGGFGFFFLFFSTLYSKKSFQVFKNYFKNF